MGLLRKIFGLESWWAKPKTKTIKKKYTRKSLSPSRRVMVLARDGYRCCYCGRTAADGTILEVDHIIPVALGGSNDMHNLQALCRKCNRGKGKKIL